VGLKTVTEAGNNSKLTGRAEFRECFMYIKARALQANKFQTKNSGQ
jgi:hypothetical protein